MCDTVADNAAQVGSDQHLGCCLGVIGTDIHTFKCLAAERESNIHG
jgi:hypothetical protein